MIKETIKATAPKTSALDAELTYPPDIDRELDLVGSEGGAASDGGYIPGVGVPVEVVAVGEGKTAATFLGITNGVEPTLLKSIEPSSLIVSTLFPRKLRVYNTFSATYERDQSGSAAMSMSLPHLAANSLPFV